MPSRSLPGPALFTVDDYNRMIKAGVFEQYAGRIELIDGELTEMSPASEEHDDVIRYLIKWATANAAADFEFGSQIGLRLLHSDSMPEPDFILIDKSHGRGRITSALTPLVVEVAVASLDYDLTVKQAIYAAEGIPEYWVIDPLAQTVIVHLNPLAKRYGKIDTFSVDQSITPQCLPNARLSLHWLFIE